MKYRVKIKEHRRFENGKIVIYQVGDVFEATEAEVKAFGDKLEKVEKDKSPEDPPIPPGDDEPKPKVKEKTSKAAPAKVISKEKAEEQPEEKAE